MTSDLYSWVDVEDYSWSDQPYIQWAIYSGHSLIQLWQDTDYVYVALVDGLDIVDLNSAEKVAYIPWKGGFSTVWASNDVVYLGSTTGVKFINKSSIVGDTEDPINLIEFLNNYNYYAPASIDIKYIHGFEDKLSIVTASGLDLVDNSVGGFKSSTNNGSIEKCFSLPDRSVYYTTTTGVFKLYSYLFDWEVPDKTFLFDVDINDIFVTQQTAVSGINNTFFIATSSGVYVYDEDINQVFNYSTELAGTSINITGIWADLDSGINNGKMYIVSSGEGAAFSIFDLNTKKLWDKYTLTEKGRDNSLLLSEDLVDLGGF